MNCYFEHYIEEQSKFFELVKTYAFFFKIMCVSLVPITIYAFLFCSFCEACPPEVAFFSPLSSDA